MAPPSPQGRATRRSRAGWGVARSASCDAEARTRLRRTPYPSPFRAPPSPEGREMDLHSPFTQEAPMTITGSTRQKLNRRLRLGMVGGGRGAFIGAVHRIAARLDDRWEFVAGALSSDPERARLSGEDLLLAPERIYTDFAEMARRERRRKDGIDAVAIVTPNHAHAPAARAFLKAGIHVICDKPLTTTPKEAEQLARLARESGLIFAVTHNYTGYPLVRQARAMVRSGALGRLRVVQVEYPQEWLATRLEDSGQKQAAWRTDPARSGPAGS